MKARIFLQAVLPVLSSFLLLTSTLSAYVENPDFTAPGVIAGLKSDAALKPDAKVFYSSRPYSQTYNLGATGLRGWIYIDGDDAGQQGMITKPSRQILITVAEAPASAVLAVDDVILGAIGTNGGAVPAFSSDCRKAFGVAIGEAEITGTLRVKRWRAGITTDESIPMTIMGDYAATAPYNCPKSAAILAQARTKLVSQLLADPKFFGAYYGSAIDALALLASVAPGDANYAAVQTRLQSFAHALAPENLALTGCASWDWGYIGIFLSEYYLRSVADGVPDASVLHGINEYTVALAKGQSRYGTFGQAGSLRKTDGSLHGTVGPYGSMNAAGIPANTAIVMGRKVLLAAGQAIDPEIDPAIQRSSDFYGYYVNKGPIPYGEHEPYINETQSGHAPNGKDAMCAALFGLQDNRPVQTEYFTRMTTAGFTGREYGHTGQGFSYLWGALGANIGGPLAVAEYLKNIRWHLDLVRRTDGSFTYDGQEQYGGGKTVDGSYLGACGYYAVRPVSSYILSYAVSLNRLYLTGKKDPGATDYTLNATQVAHAIAAATFKQDCVAYTTTQLIAKLSDYDPVVRNDAAKELAKRTPSTGEVSSLIASITNGTMSSDPNTRMGACQALGALQASDAASTALGQRLTDTDLWVRAKAANALSNYGSAARSQRTPMLSAFAANATDPEVIVWNDPIQIANGFLSKALFNSDLASFTIGADKSLLYPAVKAGLKQPDSNPRLGASSFTYYHLTSADALALTPDLIEAATSEAQADTMWHGEARATAINTLAKFKMAEAVPIALGMQVVPTGYGWGAHHFQIAALNVLSSFGDLSRWTLPALRDEALTINPTSTLYATLSNTIISIEAAIASPSGIFNALAVANSQVVTTPVGTAKAITLTGSSCRDSAVTFVNVTEPLHGWLTGTAPNLIYTPTAGYTGPDRFTFKATDTLTTSEVGTVSLIVGTAGTGLKGEYFDNPNFTNLKVTRTDPQVNFDWGTAAPDALIGADTFSVRWSGQLLIPQTGSYTFSAMNSDGVRLFINGELIIDNYVDQPTGWKDSAPVSLTEGQIVDLQMEYYENTGSAVAKLKWTGPSLAGLNGQPIAKEWLFDGTGLAYHRPYALAQSVSLVQNTSQAIVLTGSGVNLTPLTYSIITQPAHGTLSGIAPNLIYIPTSNYGGSDSFTFLVNNGTSNSGPATVSISIWGSLPNSYFWTNAVAGTWSGSFWTNAAGASVTPAATGNSSYHLNFNKSGTYTTTQDLNNPYVFNQINLAGAVTIDGSNGLTATANGSILPQINQNSTSSVSIKVPLNLAGTTTMGGTGGGNVEIPGLVTGTGGLIMDNPGTMQLYGASPNTYSGGTIVKGGTLRLGYYDGINNMSPRCVNPAGTGPITLNRTGTIQFENVNMSNALTINGGTFYSPNGYGVIWSGPVTLNATPVVNTTYGGLNFTGNISGVGGFTKTGASTLDLSGSNSFIGANFITAGTLKCNTATALGVGALNISDGAKVHLNFTGTRAIAALTFDGGTAAAPGSYGSSTSSATNKDDTYFLGNGTITILPATSTALALTGGVTPSNLGAPLTVTATVTGTASTGNVAFYDGTALIGTSALSAAFEASFTTTSLGTGTHTITAKYVGNATNADSTSSGLAIEVTTLLPATPLNLFATPGSNTVVLTWTVSAGATSYQVKRALANDGPYTTIGTPSAANYNDTSAVDGTTYYYMVSAINGAGEGANSSSVSATPFTYSSAKDILTFVFPGLPTAILSGTHVNLAVPFGTVVTALSPTYTVSNEAYGTPGSGTTRDFTNPQSYTITAPDHSNKTYVVTVTVNQLPAATAQSVSIVINTAKPITLAATDSNGDSLTYDIVTSPTNGSLSGSPPNVTYTPTTGYTGTDSFSFKANDGFVDSAAATVSLTVAPPTFTWNAAIAGNWSDATKWTAGSGPINTSVDACLLNFNATGTYAATNDLIAGFLVNQINFGGSTATLSGNSLAFSSSGTHLPQVNQNSANAATISTNMALTAHTTVGGTGAGALTLSGIISGGSSLTKTNTGTLTLSNANTYSGGTLVSNGTLTLASKSGLGTGALTLAAGTTFQQSTFEGNEVAGALPNAFVLNGNVTMNIPWAWKDVWLSQPVSGTGGFMVQGGSRSLTLTANNTFSGGITLKNYDNRIQIAHLNALGTGTFRTERTTADSGQLVSLANLSAGAGVTNAIDIASGAYLNVSADGTNHLRISGAITSAVGTGNLYKSGSATLTLTGTNTYTGTSTVAGGTLECTSATALGQGPVVITSGKLNLNFAGTRQVASLTLGGVLQANGSYGSTASPATNKNDTYFIGTGTVTVGPIATTTTLVSHLNPAAVGAPVSFTATVTGGSPTGNVSFYAGTTLLGTSALNGSFQADFTTSSLAAGTHNITATYVGDTNHSASTSEVLSQAIALPGYESWASDGARGLTVGVNDGPSADPDHDGISNLLEFALGGAPLVATQVILPKQSPGAAGTWVFEYHRSQASKSTTTQVVEYGSDLTGWTPVPIPASNVGSGMVAITPGTTSDHVKVTLSAPGKMMFVRLKVSQ